ncbi:MAG: metal-sulfur cluster assembly factor [Nitriliruptorales bacterium]
MTDYWDVALPPEETTLGEPHDVRDDETGRQPEAGPPGRTSGPPGSIAVEADGMPPVEVLHEAMKAVVDPEIGYNVVDLGLVYGVDKREDGHVQVTMTLTTMGCPLTELIHQQVSIILGALPGVKSVDVDFTFTPPWTPDMMADDVKEELRAMGMSV